MSDYRGASSHRICVKHNNENYATCKNHSINVCPSCVLDESHSFCLIIDWEEVFNSNEWEINYKELTHTIQKYNEGLIQHLNSLEFITKSLEDSKKNVSAGGVKAILKNLSLKAELNSLNDGFIVDCAKILYDKYINLIKDTFNKVLKQLTGVNDEFKKIEARATFIQRNELPLYKRFRVYDDMHQKIKMLCDKMSKEIKFFNYDLILITEDPAFKLGNIKGTMESHLEKIMLNLTN